MRRDEELGVVDVPSDSGRYLRSGLLRVLAYHSFVVDVR